MTRCPSGSSAGASHLRFVGGLPEDVDVGAVGAVGGPSAGSVSVDAEAVVDLGVVAFADQPGINGASLMRPLVPGARAAAVYAWISSDTEGKALGVTR